MSMGAAGTTADSTRRVPAEWEPQEAIWLQWLSRWEKIGETAFARKSNVIVRYETLHILYVLLCLAEGLDACPQGHHARIPTDHPHIVWHAIPTTTHGCATTVPSTSSLGTPSGGYGGQMGTQSWTFDA